MIEFRRFWWLHFGLALPMVAVSILHTIQAIAVLTDNVGTTTIIGLAFNHPADWVPFALGKTGLGVSYLIFALLAVVSVIIPRLPMGLHIALWGPQQLLMIAAALSAAEAMWIGHYLDGTGAPGSGVVISRQHIIADQAIYGIAALGHFVSFCLWQFVLNQLDSCERKATLILEGLHIGT